MLCADPPLSLLRSRPLAWSLSAALLAFAATAAAPQTASAATYHVYGCKTPSGAPAPVSGWTSSTNLPSGYGGGSNSCPNGGGLLAYLMGDINHQVGEGVTWNFQAPEPLRLVDATIWRTGMANGGGPNATAQAFWTSGRPAFDSTNVYDQCTFAYGCARIGDATYGRTDANKTVVPPQFLSDRAIISANAICGGSAGSTCYATGPGNKAEATINASDIRVDDPSAPVVRSSSGTLTAGSGILAGTVGATVQASDDGSGIYVVGVEIDGKTVASAPFPNGGQRCTALDAGDGTRGFLYVDPCPTTGATSVELDTRTIPDGVHNVSLYVEDAAGNRALVSSGSTIVKNSNIIGPGDPISLRGEPNGSPITDQGRLTGAFKVTPSKRCRSKSYRRKHKVSCSPRRSIVRRSYAAKSNSTISGRLRTPDGAAIANARISIVATPRNGGGAPREVATATTSATGLWTAQVPRTFSSVLTVKWVARTKDTLPAVTRDLQHRIGSRTSLRITPKRTRRGKSVRISGTLFSPEGNRSGVPVSVEVRYRGRWRPFATTRTNDSGRWSTRYRFSRRADRGTYRMRAKPARATGYAYETGSSNVRGVRVR